MNNYEFCAQWATRQGGKILDYGCGEGELVSLLRSKGLDAHGCDVFYDGGKFRVLPDASPYISRMEGERIPFADASFDALLSNQVIEHVPDLPAVLAEIARVLKPGGVSLHLFPTANTWQEGHVSMPFLHWFGKGPLRIRYAMLMHRLGFGLPLHGKTPFERYRDKCEWLDLWTHYRSEREIHRQFSRQGDVSYLEPQWLDARRVLPLPATVKGWIVRKAAGRVLVLRKHQLGTSTPV